MYLKIDFEEYFLDNGLRVILHQDTRTPISSVNVWYHVGSWNEQPGKTGFAHLFEHMMFQGSQNLEKDMHFRLIQSIGGTLNGSTSFNRTNYYETVPSHFLEMALWMEADRMGYLLPAMNQEKLDNQRDVVKNERRERVENQPYGDWLEKLLALAYPNNIPYHWPIIGYMEDLDSATLNDVQNFFRTYYSPANASLCVAGDFDSKRVRDWIEKHYAAIEGPKNIPAVNFNGKTINNKQQREQVIADVQLPRIYMAFHIPGIGSEEWYQADLLSDLLSAGKSARLYQSLVYEKQIAQEAYAFTFSTEQTALFLIMVTGHKNVSVDELEKTIVEEIEKLISEAPETEELDRVKNQIEAHKVRELQSISAIADALNRGAVSFDDPGYINRELGYYEKIKSENLQQFAKSFLNDSNKIVLSYLPKSK